MHPFEVLADPVRRRVVELLVDGELTAGQVVEAIGSEFGITQPAISRQLRILRETGFAVVRAEGARRLYALDPTGVDGAAVALDRYRGRVRQGLDALHTEVARGRRTGSGGSTTESPDPKERIA